MKTEGFRKQHAEILTLVHHLKADLKNLNPSLHFQTFRNQITHLLGKVQVHLTMEDHVLYPILMQSRSQDLSSLAQDYQTEMGGIKRGLINFTQEWTAEKMREEPEGFGRAGFTLLAELETRIERENEQLYTQYDAL
ncbi:hypothetical protein COW36_19175 [bacterium (Candidatus Blackallbacteria) CG17_big_fil_post_rev_8_21_14_2_50_48_46]|uniref:Hemerythrin-like domain-containing protein n=1 Tax=bacterium (Candidatus Blackallbacteria) CG17_big_fil_post_rev_8_21_14_2_50_48_46 TaxID=2014261 RepID=A0A2M7G091_9BACT|nr:MAG: hypothetical protein COW64_25295 [bacterium (Candidatus Blackallbacteria) CG18_big_fil_WC_8_21_14_2_50_49_26]PIW15047.1 MAG: hypothetical protein COW36_19175 [bacterium (Candidatus Blackallbacteria) CG17_big_fil_post_rev_8_21_14_2_50_48_46]PIW47630.1 MAG: hypothetical protein COW20_12145 [bacterium (Candidatus Blackallbacteria) CG13_big_fil_rev_8_21_14_2_50_49_14]